MIANPSVTACKICGAESLLYGVVDFAKSCADHTGARLPLSGVPVYYRRCRQCGFLFSDQFDAWSDDDFCRHIYNSGYVAVDPDYRGARAISNARLIGELFAGRLAGIPVIDYGGGNGVFADTLRRQGIDATTFDPVSRHWERPSCGAGLITAFEVLEHSATPQRTAADLASLLTEKGLILFSTLVQPEDFDRVGLGWWYVGPRNGHISIFSREALRLLFLRNGLRVASLSDGFHMAFQAVPPFAAHLFSPMRS